MRCAHRKYNTHCALSDLSPSIRAARTIAAAMCIDCGNPLLLCPVKQRPNAPAPPPRELPRLVDRPIYATGAAGSRPRAELFPTTVIGSLPRPDWVSDIVLGKKDGALGAEYVPLPCAQS